MTAVSTPSSNLISLPFSADWQRAFVDWLTNLASTRTRRTYLAAWRDFVQFRGVLPEHVTQTDILAYRHHLETSPSPHTGQSYSDSTINQRLCALSSFYKFTQVRNLRDDNPCDGIKRKPVSPYGKATWLDGEEEQDIRLLRMVDTESVQGLRDFAHSAAFSDNRPTCRSRCQPARGIAAVSRQKGLRQLCQQRRRNDRTGPCALNRRDN